MPLQNPPGCSSIITSPPPKKKLTKKIKPLPVEQKPVNVKKSKVI